MQRGSNDCFGVRFIDRFHWIAAFVVGSEEGEEEIDKRSHTKI